MDDCEQGVRPPRGAGFGDDMESKGKLLLVRIPTVSLTKSSYFVAPSQTASLHTKPDGDNFDDEFICISDVEWAKRPLIDWPDPCKCRPDRNGCCVVGKCELVAQQVECPPECPVGAMCRNKRIQNKQWKKVGVFDAGLKGRGLMVLERCKRGELVIEYLGVEVPRQTSEPMQYLLRLDGNVHIDASHRGSLARYINHSCEPNCVVERWRVAGVTRAGIFAKRVIREGEELTFDYQWDAVPGRDKTPCHCGARTCRQTIQR